MGQDEDPFNLFLSLLSPDRGTAEKNFKDIRRRLVVMLDCRGCACSDDLADEAIFRFIRQLAVRAEPFTDDPIPYLYRVSYNLYLEYIEKRFLPLPDDISEMPQPDGEETKEHLHECLDACLDKIDPESRGLVLSYYQREKQEKIDFRKTLASSMGISVNALRIRLYNIRGALGRCIEQCLGHKPPIEMD
jgi:DNA-directed RNA polymerase specialized sigma24 family protein